MANNTILEIETDFETRDQIVDRKLLKNFAILRSQLQMEAWKEIGSVGNPAFQNGWGNATIIGGGQDETAAFRKDFLGNLYLKGAIIGGTLTDGTILFTLPVNYRTKRRAVINVYANTNGPSTYFCTLAFESSGNVRIYGLIGVSNDVQLHCQIHLNN